MLVELMVRSIDYLAGGEPSVPDDNLSIPEVWGVAGLGTCALILVGLLVRNNAVLKLGSITAFSVYLMISIQLFEVGMLPYPWPPEDPRRSVSTLVFGFMWLTIAGVVWWRDYLERAVEKEALSG
ncbi:hypothetical protein LA324_05370 [Corynebacterium coyleae]|uniref:hypothetical protein n=1 Tax=Corynebacterium coyleae TaxID=53374 RepID=UPI001CCFD1CA|nr:hypothetical protein [Corynebacterium coyleae]UBI10039.1 hypothetical protein LA324_05370 [Corynebacterium coyleae]